jgi:hypothetical protein
MTTQTLTTLLAGIGGVLYDEWPTVETDMDARQSLMTVAELARALLVDDPGAPRDLVDRLRSLTD